MEQQTAPEHISPRDLANALGVTKPTIIHWLKRGWVEHTVLPNGRRRIPASELSRLLATRGGDQCSNVVRGSFFGKESAPVANHGEAGACPGENVGQGHDTTPEGANV